jgi:UPF0042 nucleotide-binding protein
MTLELDTSGRQTRTIIIVTGLSGAGKTSVMRALEDLGFYCVDNLPMPLVRQFLALTFSRGNEIKKMALGIDIRGEPFLHNVMAEINDLKTEYADCAIKTIFVNARHETLLKRYQETRRKHPLAGNGIAIHHAIEKEMVLIEPLSAMADMIIDTDLFTPHDLRHHITESFSDQMHPRQLLVNVISFGFKYGVPHESNLVCDVRFLPNPYFMPALKSFNGTNPLIGEYLFSHDAVNRYWDTLSDFLHLTFEHYYNEGRFFVAVSIGCTGGKHRSVCFAQKISEQQWPHVRFLVSHRDMGRE